MELISLLKQLLIYLDKVDRLFALAGVIFIFLGIGAKISTKYIAMDLDANQVTYVRIAGVVLTVLAFVPAIIAWIFQPVSINDLVELRTMIQDTQGSIDRGMPNQNRKDGDNRFYAFKELPYAAQFNTRSATKVDDMIKAIKPNG